MSQQVILNYPIDIYPLRRYRVIICNFLFLLFLVFVLHIDWQIITQDGLVLSMVIAGFGVILATLYYLLLTIFKPKSCMELNEQGVLFRNNYFHVGEMVLWQEIQKIHYTMDNIVTIDIYLQEQSLLDKPLRFEIPFYVKINQQYVHGKQIADILEQCISQSQQSLTEITLKDIPLTYGERLKSLFYWTGSHRNYR